MTLATTRRLGYAARSGEHVSVWVARRQRSDIPVLLVHAAADFWFQDGWRNAPTGLCPRGARCVAADFGGAPNWGNTDGQDAIEDLILDSAGRYGTLTGKVAFYATSMGALTVLNWARRPGNAERLAGAALTMPAVDLEGIYTRDPSGLAAQIDTAYGGAPTEGTYDTFDPSRNTAAIGKFSGKLRIWYGTQDTEVIPAEVEAFADATGTQAFEMPIGHVLTWDHTPVVDWLAGTIENAS